MAGFEKMKNMDYTDEVIERVWRLATVVPEVNPDLYRKDEFGAWISRYRYNERDRPLSFGWMIVRVPDGEVDGERSLRPLQWQNALAVERQKKTHRVTSEGFYNRYVKEGNLKIK